MRKTVGYYVKIQASPPVTVIAVFPIIAPQTYVSHFEGTRFSGNEMRQRLSQTARSDMPKKKSK